MARKVLIIEDDRDTRVALNIFLRAHGYDTSFAGDGIQAMAVARREHPDVILLDLGLPAGDGFITLNRLQEAAELGAIPVIVISGRDARDYRPRALQSGAFGYFEKPVDGEELASAIERVLQPAVRV